MGSFGGKCCVIRVFWQLNLCYEESHSGVCVEMGKPFCRNDLLAKVLRSHLLDMPVYLSRSNSQGKLQKILTDFNFLEAKTEKGMVFELAGDFAQAVKIIPASNHWHKVLSLLEEAIRRDIHFIERHPSTLFQCLWNSCWWYDCPEAAKHYEPLEDDRATENPPWEQEGPKLYKLLEKWRKQKGKRDPRFLWIRSLRPPYIPLESAQKTILLGHEFGVKDVAISHDNNHIVSVGDDKTIRVWNFHTGREVACFQGCKPFPVRATFLNKMEKVIYATSDGKVYVWNWQNIEEPVCVSQYNDTVQKSVLFPGSYSFKTSRKSIVIVWDTSLFRDIGKVNRPLDEVYTVVCSRDGRLIALGCLDKTIRVFASDSWNEVFCFTPYYYDKYTLVHSLAFSKDNKFLAVSGTWGVSIWELKTGKELNRFTGVYSAASCVDFSNDGRLIALGATDNTVRILNLQSGNEEQCFSGHGGDMSCVFFTKDDSFVVSGSSDMSIRIWDLAKKTFEKHRYGDGDDIGRGCTFSEDGQQLASLENTSLVRIWNSENGEQIANLDHCDKSAKLLAPKPLVCCAVFSPDGCNIATGSSDTTIRLWEIESQRELLCLSGHSGVVEKINFALNGRRIVSESSDGTLRIWEVRNGLQLNMIGETDTRVSSHAVSHDGKSITVGLENGVILVVDTDTGGIQKRLCDMGRRIEDIAFSPTDRFVIYSVRRKGICVCDITNKNELLQVIESEALMIGGKAFSPDDRWLAWKKKDKSIIVWDMKYNRKHLCIKDCNCTAHSLMFLRQDPKIFLGWNDEDVIWGWDVVNGRPLEKNKEIIHKLVKGKIGKKVRWKISKNPLEFKLRPLECLEEVAWFPGRGSISSFHPSGRTWAIKINGKLELVTLEGDIFL